MIINKLTKYKGQTFGFPNVWAIQLFDSFHRSWKHRTGNSQLEFVWDDVIVKQNSNEEEIFKIESEKHPRKKIPELKKRALEIYNCSQLKIGDIICGVKDEKIVKKIGTIVKVINNENSNFKINVDINWDRYKKTLSANKKIFKTDLEIQSISLHELNRNIFNLTNIQNIALSSEIVLNSVTKLMSRNASHNLGNWMYNKLKIKSVIATETAAMPSSKIFSNKKDLGGLVSLFYGTNRDITGNNDFNKYYGEELSELKLGRCHVSIPKGHVEGKMERPKYYMLEFREYEDKHIVIKNLYETKEDIFFKIINAELKDVAKKSALIFIHGYNNSFAEAARRAAQIAWDIPFDGVTGFFSWPSKDSVLSYLTDYDTAVSSGPLFQEFIEKLLHNTDIEKIHFIAHSMGNTLLTSTLNNLSDKESFKEKLSMIQEIVMGAPDVAQNIFESTILPKFRNVGARRTLYSSDRDKILKISEILREKKARLGDAGKVLFVSNGLDTVDASNIDAPGFFEHGYVFNSKELLSDLHMLINLGEPPAKRRLKEREKDSLKYWLFPE